MLKQNQTININNLFNVKFHIGENKEKWNPLIKNYVFGFRHGVYFFNLNKTLLLLKKLIYLFKKITQYHQVFLFIGTNHTVSCIVSLVAKTLKQPSITKKWVGGTLTNWLKIKPYIYFLYKTNVNAIYKKINKYFNYILFFINVILNLIEISKNYKKVYSINIGTSSIFMLDWYFIFIKLGEILSFCLNYKYTIIYIVSVFAYIYFFYKIYNKIMNLAKLKQLLKDNILLDYKTINLLYKAHLIILSEQNLKYKFLILFFVILKIKVLINILFFKYIDTIFCLPVFYGQVFFFSKLLDKLYGINRLISNRWVNLTLLEIRTVYKEYKHLTYFLFIIYLLELLSLIFLCFTK